MRTHAYACARAHAHTYIYVYKGQAPAGFESHRVHALKLVVDLTVMHAHDK